MSTVTIAEPLDGTRAVAGMAESPRFLHRLVRRPTAVACIAWLLLVILVAIIAPFVLPHVAHEYAGNLLAIGQGPSAAHPLGTDSLGRDILGRLLVGTRTTMIGVAEALLVSILISVPFGLAAGYLGGWFDRVAGWLTDLSLSMPGIAIVLVVLAVFPQSMFAGMITLGLLAAPYMARVVRSATLPVREELYIAAARVSGLSRPYIITRHVLSRISGTVIVLAATFAAAFLIAQTGLAFLGLIVQNPQPSWGGMIADGISVLVSHPWIIWPPGVATTLTVVAFGLLGDAVRDTAAENWSASAIAPKRRSRRTASSTPAGAAPTIDLADTAATKALVSVCGLTVRFPTAKSAVTVVDDVSFEIGAGQTVGLVGESGCGKTITAMSLLGLLPGGGEITSGQIMFEGRDLVSMTERELRSVRGRKIGLISQEPMVSLNPGFTVGWQLALGVRVHHQVSRHAARDRAVSLLRSVHLPEPELVARRYPHELSGGMAQRVAIARALAGEPELLIADEPTTALDVTVQAEILELLRELQRERGMAILLVTHDWGVVADMCDRAVVMYAGQIVEQAVLEPLFRRPQHPYTAALLASNPHHAGAAAQELPVIPGSVPRPGAWPQGCHFHPRCRYQTDECREHTIPLSEPKPGHQTRCIHYDQMPVQ